MVVILSVLSGPHAVSFFSVPGSLSDEALAKSDLGVLADAGVYIFRLPRRISSTQDIAAMVVGKPMVLIASTPT